MKTMNLQSIACNVKFAKNIAVVAAFTFGMAACTQSEDLQMTGEDAPHTAVNILAGVQGVQTRLSGDGTAFAAGDIIKFIDKNNTTVASDYSTTDGTTWTTENPLYWDLLKQDNGAKTYSFVGIYPSTASLAYTVGDTELLMAFANGKTAKKAVSLDFKHVLSKLTVTISANALFTTITNPVITLIGVSKTATFKYTDTNTAGFADFDLSNSGELTSTGASFANGKITYTFMLPAQEIKSISFTADGLLEYNSKTLAVNLEQGKNTTLTLTLEPTNEMTQQTMSISGWGEATGADGGQLQ